MAKALNCLDLQEGNPCNKCDNCTTINKQTTLDYIEIDAASHTGVDNIREEILDKVVYPPTHLKKKIYVIDEVHMLSKWAFNALLKTIEEPADNVCFILATTEIHKIPDTIISRCQVFNFKKPTNDEIFKHLENICQQESITYTPEALQMLTKIAEGGLRDAVKYVDQINILWEINQEHVTKFLGVAPESQIQDFLELIKNKETTKIFEQIDEFQNQGIDLTQFCKQILMYIDQNLNQDLEFLLKISENFTQILGMIKYYPYPSIVYKIAINKYLNPEISPVETHNNVSPWKTKITPPSTPSTSTPKKPSPQRPTPPSTPKPTPPPTPSPVKQSTTFSGETTTDPEAIKEKLVEIIDKPSLKNQFSEHVIIEAIEHWIAKITVINKMTHMILEKEDNTTYIETLLSQVAGSPLKIQCTFVKKEDYFANSLL